MSKGKKTIPQLRFPEFKNEGEWVEKTLDEVAEFLKGKGISKSDVVENGVLPCIRYGQLYTYYKETINNVISYTNVPKADLVLSKANDVIIPSSGETQEDIATASCVMKDGIALGGDLNIIRSNINGVFLSYYLNNAKKKEIAQMAQGIAVVHLYSGQLRNLKIQIPLKTEQQKIASCLSSLDEVIGTYCQKLELLKEHKKGLMQNLFPYEKNKIPRFRFKKFENNKEWITNSVESLFKFKQGIQVPLENQHLTNSSEMVRFIRIIDVTNPSEPQRFIVNPGESHLIDKNDLFMIRYGTPGIISTGFNGVIANNLFRVIWKSHTPFISKFWYYAFQRIESDIYNLSSSSSMPAISFTTLESILIQYPDNTKEQQEIASCLFSLDELIIEQTVKIEQLKLHKKGLMQGLFPKIEN